MNYWTALIVVVKLKMPFTLVQSLSLHMQLVHISRNNWEKVAPVKFLMCQVIPGEAAMQLKVSTEGMIAPTPELGEKYV